MKRAEQEGLSFNICAVFHSNIQHIIDLSHNPLIKKPAKEILEIYNKFKERKYFPDISIINHVLYGEVLQVQTKINANSFFFNLMAMFYLQCLITYRGIYIENS